MEFLEEDPCIKIWPHEIESIPEFLKLLRCADKEYMHRLDKFKLCPLISRTGLKISLLNPSEGDNAYTYGLHIFIYGVVVNRLVKKEQEEQRYKNFIGVYCNIKIYFRNDELVENEGGVISITNDCVCVTFIDENDRVSQVKLDCCHDDIPQHIDKTFFGIDLTKFLK